MLPALDAVTRLQMVSGLAASAPPPVLDMVLAIAARVLPADAHRALTEAVTAPAA